MKKVNGSSLTRIWESPKIGGDGVYTIPINDYPEEPNLTIRFSSTAGQKVRIGDGEVFIVGPGESLILIKLEGEIQAVVRMPHMEANTIFRYSFQKITEEEANELMIGNSLYLIEDEDIPF